MKRALMGLIIAVLMVTQAYAASVNITLNWTAPADEGNTTVTSYVLKMSNSTITEANFNAATAIPTVAPKAPGQRESYNITLTDGQHYYFAVKSKGKSGVASAISNVAEFNVFRPSPVTDLSAS